MENETTSLSFDGETTTPATIINVPAGCVLKLDDFDPHVDWRLFSELEPVKVVPFRPKSGVLFLYEFQDPEESDDWRTDGYRWRQSGGKVPIEYHHSCGGKIFFYALTETANRKLRQTKLFRRFAYFHDGFPNNVLIHYVGDESVANAIFPHGNSKKNTKPFCRTKPSLIGKMKKHPAPAAKTYHHFKNNAPRELIRHAVEAPRNLTQVQNLQKNERKRNLIGRCVFYALILLSQTLPHFVKSVHAHPDIEIICAYDENVKILKELVKQKKCKKNHAVGLYVDTTFNLGDFYLTIVSFKEVEFESAPIIPVFFLIHERKLEKTHQDFWRFLCVSNPFLSKATNLYVVTDEESAIINAVKCILPNASLFLCWNHLKQKCKRFLTEAKKLTENNTGVYIDDLHELFSQKTRAAYDKMLSQLAMRKWCKEFQAYYLDHIEPRIDQVGCWALSQHGLPTVNNNPAESVNSLLKRLLERKEVFVDKLVMILFRLSSSINAEILRGRYGLGNYNILPEFASAYNIIKDDPKLPKEAALSLEEIVDNVMNGRNLYKEEIIKNFPSEQEDVVDYRPNMETNGRFDIIYGMALQIYEENNIEYLLEKKCFKVNGPGDPGYVTLFPKIKCSTCRLATTCFHELAVEMATGLLRDDSVIEPGNAMQIRRRKRQGRKEGISGRKKPRPADVNDFDLHEDLNGDRIGIEEEANERARSAITEVQKKQLKSTKRKKIGTSQQVNRTNSDAAHPAGETKTLAGLTKAPFTSHAIGSKYDQEKSISISLQISDGNFKPLLECSIANFLSDECMPLSSTPVSSTTMANQEISVPTSEIVKFSTLSSGLEVITDEFRNSKIDESFARESTIKEFEEQLTTEHLPETTSDVGFSCIPEVVTCDGIEGAESKIAELKRLPEVETANNELRKTAKPRKKLGDLKLLDGPLVRFPSLRRGYARIQLNAKENDFSTSCLQSDQTLSEKDARKIKSEELFSSDHINGFLVLLREFVRSNKIIIGGLNNLDGAPSLLYEKIGQGEKMIQILHDGSRIDGHWSVAASGFSFIPEGTVGIYDSMPFPSSNNRRTATWAGPTEHVQRIISTLVRPTEKYIRVLRFPCSEQRNGFDCGPYALAFATSLLMGENPSNLEYVSGKIRENAINCLIQNNLSKFTSKKIKRAQRPISFDIPVYCLCRLTARLSNPKIIRVPYREEQMVQCFSCLEWFHRVCLNDDSVFAQKKNFKWNCPKCKPLSDL